MTRSFRTARQSSSKPPANPPDCRLGQRGRNADKADQSLYRRRRGHPLPGHHRLRLALRALPYPAGTRLRPGSPLNARLAGQRSPRLGVVPHSGDNLPPHQDPPVFSLPRAHRRETRYGSAPRSAHSCVFSCRPASALAEATADRSLSTGYPGTGWDGHAPRPRLAGRQNHGGILPPSLVSTALIRIPGVSRRSILTIGIPPVHRRFGAGSDL